MATEPDAKPQRANPADILRAIEQQIAAKDALISFLSQANQKIVREYHEDVNPIEISTKVTNELTAKGEPKPSAEIRITRKLAANTNAATIIIADMKLGMEETAKVIQQAVNRVVEAK